MNLAVTSLVSLFQVQYFVEFTALQKIILEEIKCHMLSVSYLQASSP